MKKNIPNPEVEVEEVIIEEAENGEVETEDESVDNGTVVADVEVIDADISDEIDNLDASTISDKTVQSLVKALQSERKKTKEIAIKSLVKDAGLQDHAKKIVDRFVSLGSSIQEIEGLIGDLKGTQVHQTNSVTAVFKKSSTTTKKNDAPAIGSKEWGASLVKIKNR